MMDPVSSEEIWEDGAWESVLFRAAQDPWHVQLGNGQVGQTVAVTLNLGGAEGALESAMGNCLSASSLNGPPQA